MKMYYAIIVTTVLALGSCTNNQPNTGMATVPPAAADATELAERMLAMTRPGAEHERLLRLEGNWQIATLFRPSTARAISEWREGGSARNRSILGGRFLYSVVHETWGEEVVEATLRLGFDRRTEKYTISRCDTWGTYCVDAEGVDNGLGVVTLHGTTLDPLAKTFETYRIVLDLRSEDRYTMAIDFILPGGEVLRIVESTYTRMDTGG